MNGYLLHALAEHRGDDLVRGIINDARRLREVVRTLCPEAVIAAESGRTLVGDLALVIRDARRAA
jgi:hypothetical protein